MYMFIDFRCKRIYFLHTATQVLANVGHGQSVMYLYLIIYCQIKEKLNFHKNKNLSFEFQIICRNTFEVVQ